MGVINMEAGVMCPKCSGITQRLIPPTDPSAGEDYCKKCHKSYMHIDIGILEAGSAIKIKK